MCKTWFRARVDGYVDGGQSAGAGSADGALVGMYRPKSVETTRREDCRAERSRKQKGDMQQQR